MGKLGEILSNQDIPSQDAVAMRANDTLPSTPRQRISINRSTPYVLTNTWQNINFGMNSTLDVNKFTDGGRYDFTNLKFIANPNVSEEQQYTIQMYMKFTTKQRPVTVEFRYVVPRPIEQGGDFYFPFPDTDKAQILEVIDRKYVGGLIGTVLGLTEDVNTYVTHVVESHLLPISPLLRAYGAKLQMRIQENIITAANRARLVDCYCFIVPA